MAESDPREVREKALEAGWLLKNATFNEGILRLRKQWFAELMAEQPGTLTAHALHAKLQALESLPSELQNIVNDGTMLKERPVNRRS